MSMKRFVLATLIGGIVMFLAGGLIYGVLTVSFFEANQGTAVGVMKETPDYLPLFLGQLFFGAFLTVVIGKWAGKAGVGPGLGIGAFAGLLLGFGLDLTFYGVMNIQNLMATLVDPIFFAIQFAIGGAAVGLTLDKVR